MCDQYTYTPFGLINIRAHQNELLWTFVTFQYATEVTNHDGVWYDGVGRYLLSTARYAFY